MRMLTRDEFVEAIETIKNVSNYQTDKNKLYKKYGADGYLIEPDSNIAVMNLLHIFFEEVDYDVIRTFCLENNFGQGKNNKTYKDDNGQEVDMSTPEKLYDYLMELLSKEGDSYQ